MDDDALIRIYGNINLPEGTAKRPIVTFAVFAYNQETYIREAIAGAFSQTYSPLEIILSDDCSNDSTFVVMEEMARAYQGPHLVKLRKGEVNLGTAQHVTAVSKVSRGSLLFIAAGDDISEARRCEIVVKIWLEEGSPNCCVHSSAIFFEEDKNSKKFVAASSSSLSRSECLNFSLRDTLPFLSPTCVYTSSLFSSYEPLIGGSIIEDGVMALRSFATGRLIAVNDPLVRIRKSPETAGTGYSITNPQRWNRFILSQTISYFTKLRDLQRTNFDEETKRRLQKIYMKKIFRFSRFALPTSQPQSLFQRTKFLLKYILFYPSAASLRIKFADAAKISDFSSTSVFKAAYWFVKGRHT